MDEKKQLNNIDNSENVKWYKKYLTVKNIIKLILLILLTIFITPIGIIVDIVAVRKFIKTESKRGDQAIAKLEAFLIKLMHIATISLAVIMLVITITIGGYERGVYNTLHNKDASLLLPISIVRTVNDIEIIGDTLAFDTINTEEIEVYKLYNEKYSDIDSVYVNAFSDSTKLMGDGEIFAAVKRWKAIINRINSTIRILCLSIVFVILVLTEVIFVTCKRLGKAGKIKNEER